jgi:hypothetical protein
VPDRSLDCILNVLLRPADPIGTVGLKREPDSIFQITVMDLTDDLSHAQSASRLIAVKSIRKPVLGTIEENIDWRKVIAPKHVCREVFHHPEVHGDARLANSVNCRLRLSKLDSHDQGLIRMASNGWLVATYTVCKSPSRVDRNGVERVVGCDLCNTDVTIQSWRSFINS